VSDGVTDLRMTSEVVTLVVEGLGLTSNKSLEDVNEGEYGSRDS
jgi:hypothetical protein